jgi:hypothetical protein
MSDQVQLTEANQNFMPMPGQVALTQSIMMRWAKKLGAKTDTQAYYVLGTVGVICLLIALYIFVRFGFGFGGTTPVHYAIPKNIQQKLNGTQK